MSESFLVAVLSPSPASFRSSINVTDFMNDSAEILHPAENEGMVPQWLASLEDPSSRKVTVR